MSDGNAPNRIFLRKVLYRIDFQFITERMQEDLFAFVGQEFGSYFSSQGQEMANADESDSNSEQRGQSWTNKKAQQVFVFYRSLNSDCDGIRLKIGRTFLFLELKLNFKSSKIPYYEWMAKIVGHLYENPMFRLSRIGLRKFNSFYILDIHKETLDNIFTAPYISQTNSDGFNLNTSKEMQTYNCYPYQLNFRKSYSSGNLNNQSLGITDQPAHLIAFDFDLFTFDPDELSSYSQDAKKGLSKMNSLIYKFFEKTVNTEIIDKTNSGDCFKDYHIIPF